MNKELKLSIIFIVVFLLGITSFAYFINNSPTEAGPEYTNPIFEPVLADPSIVKGDDGFFYAYGTEDNWGDGAGAKIVPIVRSDNLVDWEYIGDAFEEKPNWKEEGGIWAPDTVSYNDKYYMYYSQSTWGDANPSIGVATSRFPEGPFEDQGKLFDSKEIGVNNSIDPHFFVDGETPYLFWGSWHGIWGVEMSKDGLEYVGKKFQIAGTEFEAPYIIKRGEYYYFFGSRGTCCEGQFSTYNVAIGRAKSLKGAFLDKDGNDILNTSGSELLIGGDRFVGPGHNTIISDDADQDWIIYHAIDKKDPWIGGSTTRRPLMIDKLIWENDWPLIEDNVPSTGVQNGPIIK